MTLSRFAPFRFAALARRLALVLGLGAGAGAGACGVNEPLPPPPTGGTAAPAPSEASAAEPAPATPTAATAPRTRAELEAAAASDLARLRALAIVDVGDLVLMLPDAASACYGSPCAPDVWESWVTGEYARQVPRLDALTHLAESAVSSIYPYAGDLTVAARDVAALDALEIVNLRGLLVARPANNPNCYNTPCPQDVANANAQTAFRAGYVHAWATRAEAQKP
jgi:hypothetical protein